MTAVNGPSMVGLVFEPGPVRWLLCKALGRLWPAVLWSRAGVVREKRLRVPHLPGDDWVLLRTRLGGICGTDLGMVLLKHHPGGLLRAFFVGRAVLGHENVAEIVEVGPAVRRWQVGQRVCVDSALGCAARGLQPACRMCAAGAFCLCQRQDQGRINKAVMLGTTDGLGGSWAEYFVAHESALVEVPGWLEDELAILIDPVACALHAVLRVWPQEAQRVAVVGGGIMAMATIASLRALGWTGRIDAIVRSSLAASRATTAGADRAVITTRSRTVRGRLQPIADALGTELIEGKYGNAMLRDGYDVVYDAAGSSSSFSDATKILRARGTLALLGTPQISLVELTCLWLRELKVVGCYGRQVEIFGEKPVHTYRVVLDLVRAGRLDLSQWRPEVYPFARWREALSRAAGFEGDRPAKVAIDFRNM